MCRLFAQLFFLERRPGGARGGHPLDEASAFGTMPMRSAAGAERPMIAPARSRAADEDPGWTELRVGELPHVGPALVADRETILDRAPAKPMVLAGRAVESQAQEHDR